MGADICDANTAVREVFDMAEEITGIPIKELCFNGPMADLTRTVNLQPAVTAVNLAFLRLITENGMTPMVCAGHSLGEFSALCCAGVVDEADALRLVYRRGELMHREAERYKGAMSAILGLDIDAVSEIVRAVETRAGAVSVANHNMKTQIVITGTPDAVNLASADARERGGKAIPLKVSGAWHSQLIKGAESEFSECLKDMTFRAPDMPVLHNVTAAACENPDEIKNLMSRQLCSPVRWYDTMLHLIDEGVEVFAEIGPGKVLAGLAKKTLPKDYPATLYSINNIKEMDDFLAELA